jgi:hypothetical protein
MCEQTEWREDAPSLDLQNLTHQYNNAARSRIDTSISKKNRARVFFE